MPALVHVENLTVCVSRIGCTDANPCDGFSKFANFENFGQALLVLFRLTTGDNWNGIMKDGLRQPPESMIVNGTNPPITCSFKLDCTENCCPGCDDSDKCKENCCTSAWVTPIYFCSFILLAQFVMLNLVVAVLMQELEDADTQDKIDDGHDGEGEEGEGGVSGSGEQHKEGTRSVAPLPDENDGIPGISKPAQMDQVEKAPPARGGTKKTKVEVHPGAPPI